MPVKADSNISGWTELLETETVNDSGNNLVKCTTSTTKFSIKTPVYMRITKVDILIAHDAYGAPTNLRLEYNGGYYTLKKAVIDANTTRYYGENIPDTLYADLRFEIGRSGSDVKHYQILSCRVSQFTAKEFQASSYARINGEDIVAPFAYEYHDPDASDGYEHFQFPLRVTDWQKYDSITVTGSVGFMALNSVRCTIDGSGVPYQMSFTSSNPTGVYGHSYTWNETKYYEYDESYKGTSETTTINGTEYHGKTLFSITVDLRNVDRNSTEDLYVYFTCLANAYYSYTIQIVNVTGSLDIADVTEVSWWQKFTTFMNGLFGGDDQGALDDLGDSSNSISSNTDQIHGFEQSQQAVLDNNFAQIQTAVTFTNFAAALVFVQKYANMTFSGISGYAIVFTLPLFLGLFFYLCSRIPGITRWKTPPPRSKPKGGGKP